MMTRTNFAVSSGLLIGCIGGLLSASPVSAQPTTCGKRDAVVERLAKTYGETRRGLGMAGANALMEMYASESTGTWTITVTMANGVTCLIASGQSFEALADGLPKPGDDA